jgi:hypothetical protein
MTEAKLAPEADGGYVLNAQDAKWLNNEMGGYCSFDVPHVIVGAGDGALVLAVGSRVGPSGVGYPVDETALKHGAGVEIATNEPSEAYAKFGKLEASTGPDGLLP